MTERVLKQKGKGSVVYVVFYKYMDMVNPLNILYTGYLRDIFYNSREPSFSITTPFTHHTPLRCEFVLSWGVTSLLSRLQGPGMPGRQHTFYHTYVTDVWVYLPEPCGRKMADCRQAGTAKKRGLCTVGDSLGSLFAVSLDHAPVTGHGPRQSPATQTRRAPAFTRRARHRALSAQRFSASTTTGTARRATPDLQQLEIETSPRGPGRFAPILFHITTTSGKPEKQG